MAICYVPSTMNKASNIKLKDTNDNYTSNDVEGALEEVNEQFKDISKDISGLASKDELHEHTNKNILDSITQDKINQWDNGGNSQDNSTIPKLSTICVKNDSGNPLLTLDFDLIPKDKSTVYMNDVFTTAQGNGILKIRNDSEFDFNTNKRRSNDLSGLNGKAITSTVLTKTNSTEYAPTQDYHPATKKYVDDKFKGISTFPLDTQTTWDAINTNVLSDENNQLVVDWFNEINNDKNYFSCLFAGMIVNIWGRGSAEIEMTKVVFDGVGLTAHTIIINKSAEDKITITINTQEFSLTPKLE